MRKSFSYVLLSLVTIQLLSLLVDTIGEVLVGTEQGGVLGPSIVCSVGLVTCTSAMAIAVGNKFLCMVGLIKIECCLFGGVTFGDSVTVGCLEIIELDAPSN